MDKSLVTTNQNAKMALSKSKYLLNLTNTILDKKPSGSKFQFWLPNDSTLTRIQMRAIDSNESILCLAHDISTTFICFIKRLAKLMNQEKKCLLIIESEFLRFIVKEKLEDRIIACCSLDEAINKSPIKKYDEILVYDGRDISINSYKILKEITNDLSISASYNTQQINNREKATNEEEILQVFPNLNRFEFDDIFRGPYEIYKFVIQFVPNSARVNEQLERKNSGADKPFLWLINNFQKEIEIIVGTIIDENPTENIAIVLPYGKNEISYNLSVQKYFKALSKECSCSKYYDGIKLKKLYHLVITTYDDVKFVDFDIVILPEFDKVKKILDGETIFNAICSAKNQLHIFQKNYNEEYDDLVEIIDNRKM